MAKKPKPNKEAEPAEGDEAAVEKPSSSRKVLLAAALMCLVSLGGGFFLARMAYLEDAEVYEPEYKDAEAEEAHAEGEDDGHGGKKEKVELRTDIVDPLAKDGHEAEKAPALQADRQDTGDSKDDGHGEKAAKDDGHGEEGAEEHEKAESSLLNFGDLLTNIEGYSPDGVPTKAFLKINLVVAYRPDDGATKMMKSRKPFMRDLFNSYLRGISEADVRGMAGIMYIKAELLKRARAAAGSDLPQEILINDLIVQ